MFKVSIGQKLIPTRSSEHQFSKASVISDLQDTIAYIVIPFGGVMFLVHAFCLKANR